MRMMRGCGGGEDRMTELKRQQERQKGRRKEKKDRGQKGTDWDCGKGSELPFCVELRKRKRK